MRTLQIDHGRKLGGVIPLELPMWLEARRARVAPAKSAGSGPRSRAKSDYGNVDVQLSCSQNTGLIVARLRPYIDNKYGNGGE